MCNVCNTTFNVGRSGYNTCYNPCCNCCGWNLCGNGFLNSLFSNNRQTVCRDCCGNLRVTSGYGYNTCGYNTYGCNHWGNWNQWNGCHYGYNTDNATAPTTNNGNGYSCITRCSPFDVNNATPRNNRCWGGCNCDCDD